jgi:gluconolactonase
MLYINDSEKMHIRIFEVQPDGTLANGRVFAELKEPGKNGAPDGMKVDEHGNVYCTGPGGVWIFSPDGKLIGKIPTPEVAANIAFGEADRKMLFITAQTGLYRIRLKVAGASLPAR